MGTTESRLSDMQVLNSQLLFNLSKDSNNMLRSKSLVC